MSLIGEAVELLQEQLDNLSEPALTSEISRLRRIIDELEELEEMFP